MRSLHLLSEHPPAAVAGMGRYGHGLTRALASAGDDVHVVTNSYGGQQDDLVVDGVHLHRIAFPGAPRPASGVGEVLNWNHAVVARVLDRRARLAGVDVVVAHGWLAAIAGREVARELERPLVATFHDDVLGKHRGVLDNAGRLVQALEEDLAHEADLVVANSAYLAGRLERAFAVEPARLGVALGGVDPAVVAVDDPAAVVAAHAQARRRSGTPLVLFVKHWSREGAGDPGRAIPGVVARRPDARFAFAGDAAWRTRLRDAWGLEATLLRASRGP
ncbi:MAG: glycosyltransferase family 4 protein [Planctomycetota bacterium]|nr:glycosyltransferase family 4 protein [Planctomycetota bacterium]